MYGSAFSGVVGEMALRAAHDAGHAADDDDGGGARGIGAMRGGGGLEEGEEGDGGEVDAGDVCGENVGPVGDGFGSPEGVFEGGGVRGGGGGFGAGDAGVGDCEGRERVTGVV